METWINRNQRPANGYRRRLFMIALLLLIAAGLVIIRYLPAFVNLNRLTAPKSDKPAFRENGEPTALIQGTLGQLGLEHLAIIPEPVDYKQKPVDYPTYKILWPKDYPFVWVVSRLQADCQVYDDLSYTAIEIGENEKLVFWPVDSFGGDSLAEFLFISSSGAIPRVSSVAFIFENFADFKQTEALELIWLNIPFGLVLKPDQVPDAKLTKALKSSQGQCILELPSDADSWDIIFNGHKLAKRLPNNELSSLNLRAILNIFPSLDAISFKAGENEDRELEKMVLNEADNLRLTYLYNRKYPGYADSIAYLKGINIKRTVDGDSVNILSGEQLRLSIVDKANALTSFDKGIYYIPSTIENLEIIKSLMPMLEKLNISITLPLRLAKTVDSL